MGSFADNNGRTWPIEINVGTIRRVRKLVDVDLMDVLGGELVERLSSDPVLLADVLFAVCQPEAEKTNVTDEEFGRGLFGDAIEQATVALLEELAGFFPEGKRKVLLRALVKLKTLQVKATDLAMERLDSPEMEARLEKILADDWESELGDSSGSAPGSAASIPGNTP